MLRNKGIEQIGLNRILKSKGSITRSSRKKQLQEHIPVAKYRLTPTIRNKILNDRETVQSIIVDDEISFSSSAGTCDYERSAFCDKNHGHVITRALRLITNSTLENLGHEKPRP